MSHHMDRYKAKKQLPYGLFLEAPQHPAVIMTERQHLAQTMGYSTAAIQVFITGIWSDTTQFWFINIPLNVIQLTADHLLVPQQQGATLALHPPGASYTSIGMIPRRRTANATWYVYLIQPNRHPSYVCVSSWFRSIRFPQPLHPTPHALDSARGASVAGAKGPAGSRNAQRTRRKADGTRKHRRF